MGRTKKNPSVTRPSSKRIEEPSLSEDAQVKIEKYRMQKSRWEAMKMPLTVFSLIIFALVLEYLPEDTVNDLSSFLSIGKVLTWAIVIILALFSGAATLVANVFEKGGIPKKDRS